MLLMKMLNVLFVIFLCDNQFKRDVVTDFAVNASRNLQEGMQIDINFLWPRVHFLNVYFSIPAKTHSRQFFLNPYINVFFFTSFHVDISKGPTFCL